MAKHIQLLEIIETAPIIGPVYLILGFEVAILAIDFNVATVVMIGIIFPPHELRVYRLSLINIYRTKNKRRKRAVTLATTRSIYASTFGF